MGKRQNALKLSITLFLIMALIVGIIFATGIDFGVKGGTIVDGSGSSSARPAPFADMPDSADFVEVTKAAFDTAEKTESAATLDAELKNSSNVITTADQLVYVLRKKKSGTYKLGADFIITDAGYLSNAQELPLQGSITLDGAGHSVISNYVTSIVETKAGTNFGGFLSRIDSGATLKNLNYYLAPDALLMVAQHSPSNAFDLNLGGLVGSNLGTITNCNVNIYGTIFGLMMGNSTQKHEYVGAVIPSNRVDFNLRPRVGGVIGECAGTLDNSVVNVIGATVSASSHSTDDKYRSVGGVIASCNYRARGTKNYVPAKLHNNVFNVSPSTLLGADLLGYKSNESASNFNEVGVYFANTDYCKGTDITGNKFVNYNDLYAIPSNALGGGATGTVDNYTIPKAVGYAGYGIDTSKNSMIKTYGASFFGDDFRFSAVTDGTGAPTMQVNKRSKSTDYGTTNVGVEGQDDWVASSETELEFYRGITKNGGSYTNDKTYLVRDTYDWNRLVSLSGTAYYDKDLSNDAVVAKVLDPFSKITNSGIVSAFKSLRANVQIDTKNATGNTVTLDSKAAPAFALYAKVTGNNGDTPEANKLNTSNMTRNTGAVRNFYNEPGYSSGFHNLHIINESGAMDGATVFKYVGGLVDYVDTGVVIKNCIIDNAFEYVKNGIDKSSMSTYTAGSTYYGGVFGHIAGSLEGCVINASTSITTNLLREGGANPVVQGGFAGHTDNLSLNNIILNVKANKLAFVKSDKTMQGGIIGQAGGSLTITNSQVSSQLLSLAGEATAADSAVAGLVGEAWDMDAITVSNTRLDMQITADHSTSKNTKKSYMFGNVQDAKPIKFTNVAINMNEKFDGFGLDKLLVTNNAKANGAKTFNNVWFYNASKVQTLDSDVNALSLVGTSFEQKDNKQLIAKGIHNVAFNGTERRPLADVVATLSSPEYQANFTNFEFFVEPGGAFYDMRRNDSYDRSIYIKDNTKNRPRYIDKATLDSLGKPDVTKGKVSYEGANITCDMATLETTYNGAGTQHGGLGWYSGAGTIGNRIGGIGYTANVYPVIATKDDGSYIVDSTTGVDRYVISNYDYSLVVPRDVTNHAVTGLLATYDIQDGAEWNQLSANINSGIDYTNVDVRLASDINAANALNAIGKDSAHAWKKTFGGVEQFTMVDNPDFDNLQPESDSNPKKIEKSLGYPTITVNTIQGMGSGNTGLFGYIASGAKVENFNVVGASFNVAPTDNAPVFAATDTTDDLKYAKYNKLNLGIVAGTNNGTISNVHVRATARQTITFKSPKDVRIGLLVGYNESGTIDNCSVNAGDGKPGIIVDNNKPALNPTTPDVPNFYVGGLVGLNSSIIRDTVVNLGHYSFATKPDVAVQVGGVIGNNTAAASSITRVYVTTTADNFDKSVADKSAIFACSNIDTYASVFVAGPNSVVGKVAWVRQLGPNGTATATALANMSTPKSINYIVVKDATDATQLSDQANVRVVVNKSAGNATISLVNADNFAVSNIAYAGQSVNDTSLTFTPVGSGVGTITVISNAINSTTDWDNIANLVKGGSTFRGYTFFVRQNITFNDTINIIGDATNNFMGTINGGNHTITLSNMNMSGSSEQAMIGCLGMDGAFVDTIVKITGSYVNDTTGNAAVLVANNKGTISNVTINMVAPSGDLRIRAANAGMVAGVNNGIIRDVEVNTLPATTGLVIEGSNTAGIIAGTNAVYAGAVNAISSSEINGVYIKSNSVKVTGGKAGLVLGENGAGAKIRNVVNELVTNYGSDSFAWFDPNTDHFIKTVANGKDVVNVWALVKADNMLDAKKKYNSNLFNVMYSKGFAGNSGTLSAEATTAGVTFNVTNANNFYGFVENFEQSNVVSSSRNFTTGNTVGMTAAAVYAKKDIATLEDLNNLRQYNNNSGIKIKGLEFELSSASTIELDLASGQTNIDWDTINTFDHIINGSEGCVIKVNATNVKAGATFTGLFDTIGASGGINNVKLVFNATMAGETLNAHEGLIAKTNYGTIQNVVVEFKGTIKATEGAGVIAGQNFGLIDTCRVDLAYNAVDNADTLTIIESEKNAGILVGENSGIIIKSSASFAPNTKVKGQFVGALVGANKANGAIISEKNITSVVISGNMEGANLGGIVGQNDGVVKGINVKVDAWTPVGEGATAVFGGITAHNNGYIADVVVDMTRDSSSAKLSAIAGIAVHSSGYIGGTSEVNINAPISAVLSVAGAVVDNAGAPSTINNVVVGNVIEDVTININNTISANGAVGLAYNNSAVTNTVYVNVTKTGAITGKAMASLLGNEVHSTAPNTKALTYDIKNGIVEGNVLTSENIVIDAVNAPTANNISSTYLVNNDNIEYDDAWLVRKNTYSIDDKANIGLNEYKILTLGNEYSKGIQNGQLVIKAYANLATDEKVFMREFTRKDLPNGDYSYSHKDIALSDSVTTTEYSTDGSAHVFKPTLGKNKNRLVVLSQYILDINSVEEYAVFNKNVANYDIFYDVPISLNSDLTLSDATLVDSKGAKLSIVPMGHTTNGFSGIFLGGKHTINVDTNLSGLFNTIGKAGVVRDLIVNIGKNVALGNDNPDYVGGLAGRVYGELTNVAVKMFNDKDESCIPTLNANVMSGALVGMIDGEAVLKNTWVFMQNGRYAPANGKKSSSSTMTSFNNSYNVVNLGGVEDVDVAFSGDTFTVAITVKDVLDDADNGNSDWTVNKAIALPEVVSQVGAEKRVFKMPSDASAAAFSVSLINNNIKDLAALVKLAENQRGFNISQDEVFTLTANIDITVDELKKVDPNLFDKASNTTKFYAIGTSDVGREFKSHFVGNGHTITFGEGVTITEQRGALAGLFGRLSSTAEVKDLKVVYNTGEFVATTFSGGLSGDNASSNITNVVVEHNAKLGAKAGYFGGVFGSNTAPQGSIKGVYLVKEYDNAISPIVTGNIHDINIINRYRPTNEAFNLDLVSNGVSYDLVRRVETAKTANTTETTKANIPYYGIIDVKADTMNGYLIDKIENIGANVGGEYSAVFAKNEIASLEDLKELVTYVDKGFNMRWLEYKLTQDIDIKGTSKSELAMFKAISSEGKNAFKSIFNGNGYAINMNYVNLVGENAGLFGVIAREGIVKNVVINVSNTRVGHAGDGVDIAKTNYAGVLAARTDGTIANSLVYNKDMNGDDAKIGIGIQYVATTASNIVVAENTNVLYNVWLVEKNRPVATKVHRDINVMNIVGDCDPVLDITTISFGDADRTFISSNMSGYIYKDTDMTTDVNVTKDETGIVTFPEYIVDAAEANGRRYILSPFSLVIADESAYYTFVDTFNKSKTSFKDVAVTMNNDITLTSQSITPLGSAKRPFDGIFNGNGKHLVVNGTIVGEEYVGLFGYIGANGEVKNTIIDMNGAISARAAIDRTGKEPVASDIYVGLIAGNDGTIKNSIINMNDNVIIEATMPTEKADGIKGYTAKRVHKAAGVVKTTKMLTNVWYVRKTSAIGTLMTFSDTSNTIAGINTLTLAGTPHPIDMSIVSGVVKFVTTADSLGAKVGEFHQNYDKGVSTGADSIVATGSTSETYTWLNQDYNITSTDDIRQLAIDTKGGITFNGRTFTLADIANLPATEEYSLGTFSGIINGGNKTISVVGPGSNFALIGKLGKRGEINNVNINLGAVDAPLAIGYDAGRATGMVVGINDGTIKGGKLTAYVATSAPVDRLSLFVGVNNGTIDGYTVEVGTDSKAVNTIAVSQGYANVVGINNGNITNVTSITSNTNISAPNGTDYYSYFVADNKKEGVISGATVKLGANASILADDNNVNTAVGAIAGHNNGTIEKSDVVATGIPNVGEYFITGYKAGIFIGHNESKVDDLLADFQSVDMQGNAGFVRSRSNSANTIDINGGGYNHGNIWIVMNDTEPVASSKVATQFANIIVVEGKGTVTVDKTTTPTAYQFTATAVNDKETPNANQFNGWYDFGSNVKKTSDVSGVGEITLSVPSSAVKKGYEVVFLATIIKDGADWNNLAQFVNKGKNVESVVYQLADDIILDKATPIGTEEHPFRGQIDGQNKTITLNANIKNKADGTLYDYAGLFGYVDTATIANINVIVNGNISAKKSAGALVGYAVNSTIGTGTFDGTSFTATDKNSLAGNTMNITNNGEISANAVGLQNAYVGGAVGSALDGTLTFIKVTNTASILATSTVNANAYAGGVLGHDEGATALISNTAINNGVIAGSIAGGIIGAHTSSSDVERFNVESYSLAAKIIGSRYAGGFAGESVGNMIQGTVKYTCQSSDAGQTKAFVANFPGEYLMKNIWIVTGKDTTALDSTIDEINAGKQHSIRILRTDNVENITFDKVSRAFKAVEADDGTFAYWHYTSGVGTLYEATPDWFGKDGITKTNDVSGSALSIDITLEKVGSKANPITKADEFKGLAFYNTREVAEARATDAANKTYYVGKDINLAGNTITVDLLGYTLSSVTDETSTTANVNILTIDKNINFNNGTIAFMVLAIDETNETNATDVTISTGINSKPLTLSDTVWLSDSRVFGEADIPARDTEEATASKQFTAFGTFKISKVADSGNIVDNAMFVTRNKANAKNNTNPDKVVIGNVPLCLDRSKNAIEGYKLGADYGHYGKGTVAVSQDGSNETNVEYFFVSYIGRHKNNVDVNNKRKAFEEMDYLLKNGYTFENMTIGVHMDITIPENKTLGAGYATKFLGTFDGQGNTITFQTNYTPLFAHIGDGGVIKNFVVDVPVKEATPVFQGEGAGTVGKMENIIIVNRSDVTYPEANIAYDRVLVVQGTNATDADNTNNFTLDQGYTKLFALNVNTAINADIMKSIKIKDVAMKSINYLEINPVEFVITPTIGTAKADMMFGGVYSRKAKGAIDAFKSGIGLNELATIDTLANGNVFDLHTLSSVIASDTNWNNVVTNIGTVVSKGDKITLSANINLVDGSMPMSSAGNASATLDGANNSIILPAGYAKAVFDGYNGTIENLVIDARESGQTLENIILNSTATIFNNVVVVTKESTAVVSTAGAGVGNYPVNLVVVGDIISSITGQSIVFAVDNASIIHIEDANNDVVTTETYGTFDLTKFATPSSSYRVEKISEISNTKHLTTLNEVTIPTRVTANADILIDKNIALTNANATLDMLGNELNVASGITFTVNGANINNAIMSGAGNVVVGSDTLTKAVITAKSVDFGTTTITKPVWANAKYAGVKHIDLSQAYDGNTALFDTVYTDGEFVIVCNDSTSKYFVGAFDGAQYISIPSPLAGESAPNYVLTDSDIAFHYIAKDIATLDEYNNMVDKVTASTYLDGKTFDLVADIKAGDLAEFKAISGANAITLNGNGHVIEVYSLPANGFGNTTLNDIVVIFRQFNDPVGNPGTEEGTFAGKIGDGTVILTHADYAPKASDIVEGADYEVVRVHNYDISENTFVYNTAKKVLTFKTKAGSSFYAHEVTIDSLGKSTPVNDIRLHEMNIGALMTDTARASKEIDIMFYLPVNITLTTGKGVKAVNKITNGYPQEEAYDASRVGNKVIRIPFNLENVVLNEYTLNGVRKANYEGFVLDTGKNYIEVTMPSAMNAIDIVLDVVRFGNGKDGTLVLNNAVDTYSLVAMASPYEIANITDIVPKYTINKEGLGWRLRDDALVGNLHPDAGIYNRVIELYMAGDTLTSTPEKIVGEIHFTHTINPYNITSAEKDAFNIHIKDREYTLGDKSGVIDDALTEEYIDPVTGAKTIRDSKFSKLPVEVQNVLKSMTFTYDDDSASKSAKRVSFDYASDVVNEANANFTMRATDLIYGMINPRKVTVTLTDDKLTREFDHRVTGNTAFKDITFENLLAMATVDVDGVATALTGADGALLPEMTKYAPTSVKRRNESIRSYYYVNGGANMLNVGTYDIISNLADVPNFTFVAGLIDSTLPENIGKDANTVDGKSLTVNKATYSIDIEDDLTREGTSKKYFLSNVNINDTHFIITVKKGGKVESDINGVNIVASMTFNKTWDATTSVINGQRVFTARPGINNAIIGDRDTLELRYAGVLINSANYDLEGANVKADTIEGGTFAVNGIDLGTGLGMSRKSNYNGNTPVLNANVTAMMYKNAGFRAVATFRDGNVVDAGEYPVDIKIYSDALGGEDVTKYISVDEVATGMTKSSAGDVFSTNYTISKVTGTMVIKNKSLARTYGDDVIDGNEFVTFRSPDLDKLLRNTYTNSGAIYKERVYNVVMTVKNKAGEVVEYTNTLPAGDYTVEYDVNANPDIARNINVVFGDMALKSTVLTIGKKAVDITLSLVGDENITYGEAFLGHKIAFSTKGTDEDGNVVDVPYLGVDESKVAWSYTDANIQDSLFPAEGEPTSVIFPAGAKKFTRKDIELVLDDNHVEGAFSIAGVSVAKKKIKVTLKANLKAEKTFGDKNNKVDNVLKGALVFQNVDGSTAGALVKPSDKNTIKPKFTYTDNVGKNNITLVGISSANYEMVNGAVVAKDALVVKPGSCKVTVESIVINEKLSTTSITFSAEIVGSKNKLKNRTFELEGILNDPEVVNAAVIKYIADEKGWTDTSYNMAVTNDIVPEIVEPFKKVTPYIFMAVVGVCAVLAVAMIIFAIFGMVTMPTGFNKDFNFSRDPSKKDVASLMQASGKRRAVEYNNVSNAMKKAAKKGEFYDVEETLFPKATTDEISTESTPSSETTPSTESIPGAKSTPSSETTPGTENNTDEGDGKHSDK